MGTCCPGEEHVLERIAEKLAARGHSAARIEKIIGGNFVRLMRETWVG